jgi:hypothetical protein
MPSLRFVEDERGDDISLISQSSRSVSTYVTSATEKPDANATDDRGSGLAQQETKLVNRSKCLVLFVLLAAAAGCGAGELLLLSFDLRSMRLPSDLPLPLFRGLSHHGQWRGSRFS